MLKVEGKNFDWVNIPLKDCLEGNALDAYFTLKVYSHLLKEVENVGLVKLYEKLISPLSVVFSEIEYNGMSVDQDKLKELKDAISNKISDIEKELTQSPRIPENISLTSAQDICKILFSLEKNKETKEWEVNESFGFGLYPIFKTKTGQPQTNEESLTKLKELVDKEYARRGLNV